MDLLTDFLEGLKAFARTQPVAYGAPLCAVAGAVAGLALQTGPQDGPYPLEMEPARYAEQEVAQPISWPAGKVPDYVVGTDFLKQSEPPPMQMASYEPAYAPPPAPAPEIPPYVPAQHGPAPPPPDPDGPRWASERGDITDVSLPEDRAAARGPAPTALADAAATGLTTR